MPDFVRRGFFVLTFIFFIICAMLIPFGKETGENPVRARRRKTRCKGCFSYSAPHTEKKPLGNREGEKQCVKPKYFPYADSRLRRECRLWE